MRGGEGKKVELPEYLTDEQWEEWRQYRLEDKKEKKFSDRAQRAFIRKCKKLHAEGYDVPALIDHAMDVGWLTVWPHEQMKRKKRHRETTVTDLRVVETSDKETGRANIAALKQQARGA